jgi:hypothetical protein
MESAWHYGRGIWDYTHLFGNLFTAVLALGAVLDDRVAREVCIEPRETVENETDCKEIDEGINESPVFNWGVSFHGLCVVGRVWTNP